LLIVDYLLPVSTKKLILIDYLAKTGLFPKFLKIRY